MKKFVAVLLTAALGGAGCGSPGPIIGVDLVEVGNVGGGLRNHRCRLPCVLLSSDYDPAITRLLVSPKICYRFANFMLKNS